MCIGSYGFGIVIGMRCDLGVFVDVGLLDKDVVILLDELLIMWEFWFKKED